MERKEILRILREVQGKKRPPVWWWVLVASITLLALALLIGRM